MAIGNELRRSIAQAVQTQAVTQARLAQMLGMSRSSVKCIGQRWRHSGSAQLLPFAGGKRPKLTAEPSEVIRQYVLADTALVHKSADRIFVRIAGQEELLSPKPSMSFPVNKAQRQKFSKTRYRVKN